MNPNFAPHVVATLKDGDCPVWLTPDDRWSADPQEAEILSEEAIATVRLLEARSFAGPAEFVRLVQHCQPTDA
jgi:hypothetical protein